MSENKSVTKKKYTVPALLLSCYQMNIPKVTNLGNCFFQDSPRRRGHRRLLHILDWAQSKWHKIRLPHVWPCRETLCFLKSIICEHTENILIYWIFPKFHRLVPSHHGSAYKKKKKSKKVVWLLVEYGSSNRPIFNKLSQYILNSECPRVFMR